MAIRIQPYERSRYNQGTKITLRGPVGQIIISVESRMPIRQQKEIALSFIRQIKPWLRYFRNSTVTYKNVNWVPNFERNRLDLSRSCGIENSLAEFGNGSAQTIIYRPKPIEDFTSV